MCGIVGIASATLLRKEEQVFEGMLLADVIRGKDATGVAVIQGNRDWEIVKQVGHPLEVLESKAYDRARKGHITAMIGHNRWGTVGKNSKANAHPFEFDTLVGVHNGTLTNKLTIDPLCLYNTDSEGLYAAIEQGGLEPTLKRARGAWALVYYNKNNDSLNFVRNKERPLSYALSKDGKTLVWASEAWMMLALCARENIELGKYHDFTVDTHYEFKIPAAGKAFDKPTCKIAKGAPEPIVVPATSNYGRNFPVTSPAGTYGGTSSINSNDPALRKVLGETLDFKVSYAAISDRDQWYLRLIPEENELKKYEFRMYFSSFAATQEFMGTRVESLVSSMQVSDDKFKFFRVNPEVSNKELIKKDEKGFEVTAESFEARYKDGCAWCGDVVQFEDEWTPMDSNTLVCNACSQHPDVKMFLKVA